MKKLSLVFLVLLFALASNVVSAQVQPVDNDHLAIGGYDVVAYFTANKATKGNATHAVTHEGVNYHFDSVKNQKAFKSNPTKYLPQCNGYCAWGVAEKGTKFPINPETFAVSDGKLYLFFNGDFQGQPFNTLTEWKKDEKKYLATLNNAWEKVNKQ
jgi:YHS domain-containing protein